MSVNSKNPVGKTETFQNEALTKAQEELLTATDKWTSDQFDQAQKSVTKAQDILSSIQKASLSKDDQEGLARLSQKCTSLNSLITNDISSKPIQSETKKTEENMKVSELLNRAEEKLKEAESKIGVSENTIAENYLREGFSTLKKIGSNATQNEGKQYSEIERKAKALSKKNDEALKENVVADSLEPKKTSDIEQKLKEAEAEKVNAEKSEQATGSSSEKVTAENNTLALNERFNAIESLLNEAENKLKEGSSEETSNLLEKAQENLGEIPTDLSESNAKRSQDFTERYCDLCEKNEEALEAQSQKSEQATGSSSDKVTAEIKTLTLDDRLNAIDNLLIEAEKKLKEGSSKETSKLLKEAQENLDKVPENLTQHQYNRDKYYQLKFDELLSKNEAQTLNDRLNAIDNLLIEAEKKLKEGSSKETSKLLKEAQENLDKVPENLTQHQYNRDKYYQLKFDELLFKNEEALKAQSQKSKQATGSSSEKVTTESKTLTHDERLNAIDNMLLEAEKNIDASDHSSAEALLQIIQKEIVALPSLENKSKTETLISGFKRISRKINEKPKAPPKERRPIQLASTIHTFLFPPTKLNQEVKEKLNLIEENLRNAEQNFNRGYTKAGSLYLGEANKIINALDSNHIAKSSSNSNRFIDLCSKRDRVNIEKQHSIEIEKLSIEIDKINKEIDAGQNALKANTHTLAREHENSAKKLLEESHLPKEIKRNLQERIETIHDNISPQQEAKERGEGEIPPPNNPPPQEPQTWSLADWLNPFTYQIFGGGNKQQAR